MPIKPRCECGECRLCKKRENQRRYRERHRERALESNRRWRSTHPGAEYASKRKHPNWLEINRDRVRRYRARHPERDAAHSKVSDALRYGKLSRQPCEVCGNTKSEAHHDDYAKPLEVRWLCRKHHYAHHHQTK